MKQRCGWSRAHQQMISQTCSSGPDRGKQSATANQSERGKQRIRVLESKVVVVYACTAVPRASAPARPRLPSAPSSPLLQPRARGVLSSCQSTRVNCRRARAIKPSLPRPTRRRSYTERTRARAPPHLSEGRSFPRSKAGRACRTRRTAAARGGFSVRWAWRGCVAGHVDPGGA